MNKKGFTLIELLAVIVILAIIALIAVPLVLNIIEKARSGAAKSSAYSYIKAVETYAVTSELDNKNKLEKNTRYNVTISTTIDDKTYESLNNLVEIKGSKPIGSDDYILLDDKKNVKDGKLTIDNYVIIIKNGNIESVTKGKPIEVESITVDENSINLELNTTHQINAKVLPEKASNKSITYTSENNDIAEVDNKGLITAKKVGTTNIVLKANNGKTATINVTIVVSPSGVTLNKTSASIKVGSTVQLTAIVSPENATDKSVTWTSSNNGIATVSSNGLVTGKGVGTAVITAKTSNGKTETASITVEASEEKRYIIKDGANSLGLSWETETIVGTVTGTFNNNGSLLLSHSHSAGSTSYYMPTSKINIDGYTGIACDFEIVSGDWSPKFNFGISNSNSYWDISYIGSSDGASGVCQRQTKKYSFGGGIKEAYLALTIGNGEGTDIVRIYNLYLYK